uniref:Uncharacterized protein n=1 Tax=Plectus sambesii TaxID=2011161 RepID=A0A914X2C7_9BILA
MRYYAGDDTKTTASTGLYILTSLTFIRLHTLNYTDNDDSTDDDTSNDGNDEGINGENDSGVDYKTTASISATQRRRQHDHCECQFLHLHVAGVHLTTCARVNG